MKNNTNVTMKLAIGYTTNDDNGTISVTITEREYAIPSSKYITNVNKFVTHVRYYALDMVRVTMVNDANALDTRIDDAMKKDTISALEIEEMTDTRDALYTTIDDLNNRLANFTCSYENEPDKFYTFSSSSIDNIALVTAFSIVKPRYMKFKKYGDANALISSIRNAYDASNDDARATDITATRKAIRDDVITFVSPYLIPNVNNIGDDGLYKNIKPRLSLEETRQLIDTIGAYTLKWDKRGINAKRVNDNTALVQMWLYVLRVCFDIAVIGNIKKIDTNVYTIV